MLTVLAIAAQLAASVSALDNGFGRRPVMGYNSYNDIGCSPNSTHMEDTIRALSAKGFVDLGYKIFQIDCGWQGYSRLANGSITYDNVTFPHGIRPISNLAISKGMEWGMYTDEGVNSCDTITNPLRPGSLGYEKQDAAMFAAWNTVYVKVDNCYVTAGNDAPKNPRKDFSTRYGAMSSALESYGIKGMLVCEWGVPYVNRTAGLQGPAQWTPPLSTSFRAADDIASGWANVLRIMNEAINIELRGLSGPGHFGDMDLLEVGNPAFTLAEQRSHFALWSMFKSTLMISTDVPNMSNETFAILANKDLLDINQDEMGVPVKLVQRFTGNYDLFSGPLSNSAMAVLALDQSNTTRTLSVKFSELGIASADAKNLWTGRSQKAATSFSAHIGTHGSIPLRLSNIKFLDTPKQTYKYFEAESATLAGGAKVQSCSGCSGGEKAGEIEGNATVTFKGIKTSQETSDVLFDYIDCEIGYLSTQGTNTRGTTVTVNGGAPQDVVFPLTGYNWNTDVLKGFRVRLSGFKTDGSNTIILAALPSATRFAPEFDRIGVLV